MHLRQAAGRVPYVGSPDGACPFWSGVRRGWVGLADPEGIEGYPKLRNDFELKRRRPGLLYERRRPSAAFRSYARLTRAFFESIRAVSGKPAVVGCSKKPAGAFALGMVPGIELYAVHLVRDGRGVTTSHRGSFEEGLRSGTTPDRDGIAPRKTIVRRRVLYLVSEWVCARLGPNRAMRLRYEDCVADPEGALERIGSPIGHDLRDLARAASSGGPMQAGPNVGGNRTRVLANFLRGPVA